MNILPFTHLCASFQIPSLLSYDNKCLQAIGLLYLGLVWSEITCSIHPATILYECWNLFQTELNWLWRVLIWNCLLFGSSSKTNLTLEQNTPKIFFISISNTLSEGFCWTWGFTRYHPLYTISFQKIEQIAIEWSVFWAIFADFWGREPRLCCEISDPNLTVFGDFYALNHFVCHRFT